MLRPMPCTAKELALAVELSERRVSALTTSGIFSKPYDLIKCARAYINFLKKPTGSLTGERARLTKAQADWHELKLRQKTGELVEIASVSKQIFTMVRQTRDQFQNIPARWSGLLAAEHDQAKVFTILTTAIHEILVELSNGAQEHQPRRSDSSHERRLIATRRG
jgi:hypothetical protein